MRRRRGSWAGLCKCNLKKVAGNPSFAGGLFGALTRLPSLHSLSAATSAAAASWSHFSRRAPWSGGWLRLHPPHLRAVRTPRPRCLLLRQPETLGGPQAGPFWVGLRHRAAEEPGRKGGRQAGRGVGVTGWEETPLRAQTRQPRGRMRRGAQQPLLLEAQPASPPMDSGGSSLPAAFIQIRSSSGASVLGLPCSPGSAAGGLQPHTLGGDGGASLCRTPHGPVGRTVLLQPARGSAGRPSVITPPSPSMGGWGLVPFKKGCRKRG